MVASKVGNHIRRVAQSGGNDFAQLKRLSIGPRHCTNGCASLPVTMWSYEREYYSRTRQLAQHSGEREEVSPLIFN